MKKTVLAFALVAASCAFASDKFWHPQSGSTAWSGRNWIGIGGDCFEDGDNAVFSDYYGDKTASATVDTDVTAAKISASIPTTISKGEAATTNSYTYFRFKIEGRKGNDNGMVQIAELKLYSGDTDITQGNIQRYYDSSTVNVDNEKYPDNEAPYKLVDGNIDTKWLDRRLKDGSSPASLDAVWLAVGFSEPKQVTKYEWFTANDAEARDPAAWRLQGSNDNPDSSEARWVDLDVRSGFTATSERKASAGKWTIDYSPTLSADEIEVSEGTTLTLGMAPVSSFAKTGAGTLVASAGISNGIDMQAGGLDLGGNSLSVTTAILPKDGSVAFYNGTYSTGSENWTIGDDAPAEWVIGSRAVFTGAPRIVLSPESADRECHLLIKDGGRLVIGSNNNYIQHHDYGKTIIEITGEGSEFACSSEIYMIPSNDSQCQNPRADLLVTDGGTLTMARRLSWGQKDTKFAISPEGYMLVSNANVVVSDCIDFGIKSDYSNTTYWDESAMLSGGWYKAEFVDGAYVKAQRIFVGRERENVEIKFDGATFESRANSSDFLMQDRRDDAPFVVEGDGLTVVCNHNTVLKGHLRGTGGIVKQGTDKIDIYYDQYFTGALQCDSGTINDTSSSGITFAAGAIVMNGGTMNLSSATFTNETISLSLNGGTMHVFDNGAVETNTLGDVTFGAGFAFRFDVSSSGSDAFAVATGSNVTVNATAESPFVFTPKVLSALPVNEASKLVTGTGLSASDAAKFTCSEEGYIIGIDEDGDITITHESEDRVYGGGTVGANWSDAVWGENADETFVSGDNAIFTNAADTVKLDKAVTVGTLAALEDARITADEWTDPTPKYKKFRFHISRTKSNNDMMQLSEIELYSGWTKISPSSIEYDTTSYSGYENFPSGEAPGYAVDGSTSTKWLDRRGGNGRSEEARAKCYIDMVYEDAFALTRYRWYTANDEQGRDPYSWEVLGYDDVKGEWVTLDAKVSENVTESRNALAGTWEIAYDVEEQPSLRVSEAITVAEGKTLTVDAPFGGKVVKKGAGTLKVTQPLENGLVLEAGGLDLSGGSLGFSAGDLSADGVIAYYNGTFTYAVDPLDPGLNMPRLWTIGEGATVSGPTYASINTPQDGEDYELRVDGGRLVLGSGTSWMQSNSTGKFKLSVTNGAAAAFAGNLYCVASNEKVLDLAQIDIDVKDDAALSVGRNFTFGRENTKHAKVLYAALSVVGASLSVGEGLHLGDVNDDSTSRAGWYHLYFGTNSVVTVRDLKVWDDRDETTVVFDGATIKSRGEHTEFIKFASRNDIPRGSSPFEIAAGGLTIANEHNVAVADTLKGAGALTKTGGGLLKFSAGQEFTGAFTIAGPVDFNGQTFASSGVVLAPGGSMAVTYGKGGFSGLCPVTVSEITATADNPFVVSVTYDVDVEQNKYFDLFPAATGWTDADLAKISINGLDLEVRNGKLYGIVTPVERTWSNASGDTLMTTSGNWTGGEGPKGFDSVLFPLAAGGTASNDYASLTLSGVRFAAGAGEFAISGNGLDVRAVTNESANVQTFSCAVRDSGATLGLGGSGDIAFVGGLTTGASTEITKGGAGTVTVAGKGPGGRLVLNEGGFRLADLGSNTTNPFSTASDAMSVAGTLDLGGATQTVTMSSTSGETFALDGFTLTNGVVKIATGNHYFAPNGSFTLCGSGTEVRIEGTDGPVLNFARGDSEGKMHVKIADGARLYSHSSQENVYVASGSGVSEVTIELQNGGRFHPDNCDTQFGRSGNTAIMFGEGSWVDVNRNAFYLVGDSAGAVATVNITNGNFKAGLVCGGRSGWESAPDVSVAEFNMKGGTLNVRGLVAYNIASFRAVLDGVTITPDQDNDDFFKVDGYAGGGTPFKIGEDGIEFTTDHAIGIAQTLAGEGGITVSAGTLTVTTNQAYTGATVLKSGTTLTATGMEFAGSISLESGASITVPEIAEGKKFVRIAKAAAFEGVDETEKDDDGNHFFTTSDGWLCYGRRPGFSLKIR
ncbi:MAG: hypothetical protein IJG18_06175 [Kiritimatiellae bacterium]|nr:hypothetical protein [Kiritimatiellia bacterium]